MLPSVGRAHSAVVASQLDQPMPDYSPLVECRGLAQRLPVSPDPKSYHLLEILLARSLLAQHLEEIYAGYVEGR